MKARADGWRPLSPTPEGTLMPCFSNPSGSLVEFFAHPKTADEVVVEGVSVRGEVIGSRRYRCEIVGRWPNGDVQLRCVQQ